MPQEFHTLGHRVTEFEQFDTFPAPPRCSGISMVSDEVAAVCPVTGQPDWYTVSIDYLPNTLCLESKSLKLYLQSFRNHGIFCEAFAETIANDLYEALAPQWVNVIVEQKPRGGITITARAVREMGDGNE